jgi:hypothetical protein
MCFPVVAPSNAVAAFAEANDSNIIVAITGNDAIGRKRTYLTSSMTGEGGPLGNACAQRLRAER